MLWKLSFWKYKMLIMISKIRLDRQRTTCVMGETCFNTDIEAMLYIACAIPLKELSNIANLDISWVTTNLIATTGAKMINPYARQVCIIIYRSNKNLHVLVSQVPTKIIYMSLMSFALIPEFECAFNASVSSS